MASSINTIFNASRSITIDLNIDSLEKNLALKVSTRGTQKIFELVPISSIPKPTGWGFLSRKKEECTYIIGKKLVDLVIKAANEQQAPTTLGRLTSNQNFRAFAHSVRGAESVKTKFQRGVNKAIYLQKGASALPTAVSEGKSAVIEESTEEQSPKVTTSETARMKKIPLTPPYWQEGLLPGHPYGGSLEKYLKSWKADGSTRLSFEDWLKEKRIAPSQLVDYLDERQRKDCAILIRSGRVWQYGKLFDTASCEAGEQMGAAIYVIDSNQQFYAGNHHVGKFHHSSFLSGGPVLGAGTIKTNSEGEVLEISNESGHYKPPREQLLNTLRLLALNGVDLTKVQVREKRADGHVYRFDSAETFLRSAGGCPPNGCDSFQFMESGGKITGLIQSDTSIGGPDTALGVKKMIALFHLDPETLAFSERISGGDVVQYPSLSAYLKAEGTLPPTQWDRGQIILDPSGHFLVIKDRPAKTEEADLCSSLFFLKTLLRKGVSLANVSFSDGTKTTPVPADKYLATIAERYGLLLMAKQSS